MTVQKSAASIKKLYASRSATARAYRNNLSVAILSIATQLRKTNF